MPGTKSLAVALLAFALAMTVTRGYAAGSQPDSLTDIAMQQHFTLTDDLLARYQAAHADIHANPCEALPPVNVQALRSGRAPSFDEAAARYDARPATHAILIRHHITAKDYLLTQAVISAARLKYARQMMGKQNLQAIDGMDPGAISSGNYDFYVAHRSQIRKALQQETHAHSSADLSRQLACMSKKLQGK